MFRLLLHLCHGSHHIRWSVMAYILRQAHASTIHIRSEFMIRPSTYSLFATLFGIKQNTKQIFHTALMYIERLIC